MLLVVAVSTAAMLLIHLAPGDAFSSFDTDPRVAAAERARLGLDRPFVEQYFSWLSRAAAFDLGESSRYKRPVTSLLRERAGNTALLGSAALLIALALGIPSGVWTGSAPRDWRSAALRISALLLVATPPLVTALVLLLVAARTGWLPTGGIDSMSQARELGASFVYLPLPALALALPIAASLERMQSMAIQEALMSPCIAAARARGVTSRRAIWVHAWRLSLRPIVGVLGIVAGTVLSGSFVVEYVMAWPGLGDLMYQALLSRDIYLAAGCAATGAAFLAAALVAADIALTIVDPRIMESR